MRITYIANHPEYYATVAGWYMSFWGKNYPERTNEDWEAYIGKNTNAPPITIIAIDDSKDSHPLLGTASLRLGDLGGYDFNTAWLSALFVPEEHRGKGIATELIKEIIRIASEQYVELYLFTRTSGKIYKNLGWETVTETEYQGTKVIVMRLNLKRIA